MMSNEPSMSAQLVEHLRDLRTGTWDQAVLRRTRLCLFDSLACYCAGRNLPHMQPAATVAHKLFGGTPTDSDARLSPFLSAYLYGQAANALDYDDTLLTHPGPPIVGAVLAVAAQHRLSADRLLRGIAAGYEATTILAAAGTPSRERAALVRGVGIWDTVGASVGCCVALGLADNLLERVIGVALAHSLPPYTAKWYQRPVPSLKNNMGWVAAGAVMSVELAVTGLSGVTDPLEGQTGMWRMVGSDQWAIDKLSFEKPAVLRVGFKQFPACWHLQQHLKTFSSLLASLAPDDEVAQVVVKGPADIEKFCQPGLAGTADIAFSLPATFSLLIAGVEPGPLWDHLEKVVGQHDFRYERAEQKEIQIRTRGGVELTGKVDGGDMRDLAAWGLDEDGVLAKYKRLTEPLLHTEATAAFARDDASDLQKVPERFYSAVAQLMAYQEPT